VGKTQTETGFAMTNLSLNFSRAIAGGRQNEAPLPTRANLLVTLLRKRAAARCVGADDLEALLRSQILWSLPTCYGEDVEDVAA
jgi:hypothetical protein